MSLRTLAREPLVHFLALGALLFAADAWLRPRRAEEAPASRAPVTAIVVPPEVKAEDRERWIEEEVLYREGLARGFDRDDPRVKQRIAGKMARVLESEVVLPEATDAELRAFFDAHRSQWDKTELFDFTNVFTTDAAQAADLLARLSAGADPSGLGETFSGGRRYRRRALADLTDAFGPEFTAGLADQKEGTWALRRSRHGFHVIRVDRRSPAESASFESVKDEVRLAYDESRRAERARAALRELAKKWPVSP